MKLRHLSFIPVLACLLTACALFETGPGRTLSQAQADHTYCLREGYRFPSDSYTACRRTQAELRQRETWTELQLMKQNGGMAQTPAVQRDRMSGYRPIREENFYCYPEVLNNQRYILCKQHR
ncbi:MAG TPA: hypothetical protein VFP95_05935 [Gammaproteobacteria bacterium]|nr:hypothetical protein [Gammaproteobacteria bacterium]